MQFPLAIVEKQFPGRQAQYVGEPHLSMIAARQPYKSAVNIWGDWLRRLSNADKHNGIAVVLLAPTDFEVISVKDGTIGKIRRSTAPVEAGAEIIRIEASSDPGKSGQVRLRTPMTPEVAFGTGDRVLTTLRSARAYLRRS